MPTYEYLCRNCGHRFEVVQSFADEPLEICDECGGELRKVFAPPAISFKGSGFYATDHGRTKKQAPEGAKSETTEKKTESKREPSPKKDTGAHPKEEASS